MYTFQEIVAKLTAFWDKYGCSICQPYDIEKGAGTSNPATFFRCLGPEPFRAAYIEPCRRPKDGRYGTNPLRMQHYYQYQVILKPSPVDIQDLYLKSLEAIGFNLSNHDIRFVHDDWEQPTLGAWGLGWEVWIDGGECSQFTYFQAMAELPLKPVTGELTYGLERLAMHLQKKDHFTEIQWNDTLTYGDIFSQNEVEWTQFNLESLNPEMWLRYFEDYQKEVQRLISINLPIPAYDFILKSSHAFNLLDARGVISVSERARYIGTIRSMARLVAEEYIESRKRQGFPLLSKKWKSHSIKKEATSYTPASVSHDKKTGDFLLEIGSEELPASFVSIGITNLEKQIKTLLAKEDLKFSSLQMFGTPRRLAVLVHDLELQSTPKVVEKKGPSLETAFDESGKPTQIGQGFLRSFEASHATRADIETKKLPQIEIREIRRVPYLFGVQQTETVEARAILQKALPQIILDIDFPKKMRWADFDISYARPIRWIAALIDQEVIPFSVGPIESDRTSYGHRQLSPMAFEIDRASDYAGSLKMRQVIADAKERHKDILHQLQTIEKEFGLTALVVDRVSHEVAQLVEKPFLTLGEFDSSFLKVPREVLISEMVEHQKYFPVTKSDGSLANYFIITANVPPTDSIRYGNRKVLSARLADGAFLFEQDLKQPLESFNETLKTITFQKGLGTLFDKINRLADHVKIIHPYLPKANLQFALEAAKLCKADLASEMIGEFPELQGQMGRIYATIQKRPQEVALAIDEHWMPRGEKAALPTTEEGAIVSLSDKIDNLLGFFGLNLKPTSSSDPYALRRQALGLVRIIFDKQISFSLSTILKMALKNFPMEIQNQGDTLVNEVLSYCVARARGILQDVGYPKDEIEACLAIRPDNLYDVRCRLEALHTFRQESKNFGQVIEVHKRCQGQINGHLRQELSSDLFCEPAEKILYTSIQTSRTPYLLAIKNRQYSEALRLLADLQPELAELFEKVKILDSVEKIRNNRLALLQEVSELFAELADFQKIQ